MKIVPFLTVLLPVKRFEIAFARAPLLNLQPFYKRPYLLRFGVIILSAQIITQAQTIAQAQIIPDGTLSTTSNSPDGENFTIENGDRTGNNLFHSFSAFSVPTNGSVIFNNAIDVQNIFSRVTGANVSNIDGVIQANGVANLFLLNPHGLFLGPNARLDIGGSFLGTTATSIGFADGVAFSAADTTVNPILTLSIPTGLQMGQNPGAITSQAAYFEARPEKGLALMGGDIFLQGISDDLIDFAYLNAPDGHIELGSVGNNSLVTLTPSPTGWTFGYDHIASFGDILLEKTFVEVSGNGGGTIQLQGDRVELTGTSQIYTTTAGSVSGGGIIIQARDSLSLMGTNPTGDFSSGLFSNVRAGAEGNGGDINIDTPSLRLIDGGVIQFLGEGQGSLGNLTVQANHIEILDRSTSGQPSNIVSSNYGSSQIPGGNISLNTQTLTLRNGGRINISSRTDNSDSGNLIIRAHTIDAFGKDESARPVQTLIAVAARADGNGGTADIITDQLTLRGDAQIFVGTQHGAGTGGNLTLQATDIYFDRAGYSGNLSTGINISTGPDTQGDAGILDLQTQRLTLLNGAQVFGGTIGSGDGGLVKIQADDIIISGTGTDRLFDGIVGSSITTASNQTASGNAGNIELQTRRLYLSEGGTVFSGVRGNGDGGSIIIQSSEVIATGSGVNEASGIIASLGVMAEGRSGKIDITSDSVVIRNGAEISSDTLGMGDAGIIRIQATDLILVDGSNSQIQNGVFLPTAVGQGGQIDLQTPQLQISNGGRISTESVGQGNAGNIDIQADQVSLWANAVINSQSTDQGDAGNITLRGDSLSLRNTSSINAATALGNGGNLNLTFADVLYLRGASQLTAEANGMGNGGNVSISVPIVLAMENSDIIANAMDGNGGNISIVTQALLGLEVRNFLTPENDITASSQTGVDGIVQIQTPDLDPSQGTVELPSMLTDPSHQISTGCLVAADNSFVMTGRGGLSENPSTLDSSTIWEDFRPLETDKNMGSTTVPVTVSVIGSTTGPAAGPTNAPPIEATELAMNEDGQVEFIASTAAMPHPHIRHCGSRASL
ncbi:two-partner secretion domain-containing protein [Leptothoe sp. PORK10 BA2]|uniref:two-partner secretion domain-containing protein n=1 Tax=Leptothoe sp. PORK10 BA2 TaxID=3110254 RepID=UPI002B205C25|nr:filamentous hemagglutinin N-terminal domain-containing protein [Leptothoe sp. PORK10 BA2]MEA5464364.1 filamentous hemagglutinin N-terminal domain-containing protein [Leptothoe sp. PORK10 BA2]